MINDTKLQHRLALRCSFGGVFLGPELQIHFLLKVVSLIWMYFILFLFHNKHDSKMHHLLPCSHDALRGRSEEANFGACLIMHSMGIEQCGG